MLQRGDKIMEYNPSDNPESRLEPLDEPTRVVIHTIVAQKRLALLITEDLVFRTQKVISQSRILRHHEKSHQSIEKEIMTTERQIEQLRTNLVIVSTDDEARQLREEIQFQEVLLPHIIERRNASHEDLDIYRGNLAHAQDASHTFLLDIFGNAGLLELPQAESEVDQDPNEAELIDNDGSGPKAGSVVMDDDELLSRNTYKELTEVDDELREAQRIFNNLDDVYEEYEAEMAKEGEFYLARSEFDRMFLANNMAATTRLIQAQKAFKAKKRQAKAFGVVGSGWGDEFGYGEYEAPSAASVDMREYQASRDWSFVEKWMGLQTETNSFYTPKTQAEETEIDNWDARLEDMWDSISAVDHREDSRDDFELWGEICDGKVEGESMVDHSSQDYEDNLSATKQSSEFEDGHQPINKSQESGPALSPGRGSHKSGQDS